MEKYFRKKHRTQIGSEDYASHRFSKNHKIDFCCKGNRSLEEVANRTISSVEVLRGEINESQSRTNNDKCYFKSWPLDFACRLL